jgi:hypothetical protein
LSDLHFAHGCPGGRRLVRMFVQALERPLGRLGRPLDGGSASRVLAARL